MIVFIHLCCTSEHTEIFIVRRVCRTIAKPGKSDILMRTLATDGLVRGLPTEERSNQADGFEGTWSQGMKVALRNKKRLESGLSFILYKAMQPCQCLAFNLMRPVANFCPLIL